MICSFICGAYFSFDIPAELEVDIENLFEITETKYSLLYSVYSFPNMVLPLFGGIFLDKVGYDKGLIIATSFVSVG